MLEVLATGYPSIDTILPVSHCPSANDTGLLGALPEDIAQTYGGCGANVAVGLSRLGYRVGLATLLGADEEGAAYLAHLRDEGVDTRDVQRVAGARSSRNWLMVAPDGEYQNFYYPGASAADWQGEIEFAGMADTRYALLTAGPLHYCRAFAAAALAYEVPLIWQLKATFATYPNDDLAAFWNQAPIVMMNAGEAVWLCKKLGLASPRDLLRGAARVVIVTRGAAGAELYFDDGEAHIPSFPLSETYAVGAGDAFTAGFLDGFLHGAGWVECARRGITLASFALSQRGAQSGLPNRATFEEKHQEFWSTS